MLVDELSAISGMSPSYLNWLSNSASRRYYRFEIDKRRGDEKREIFHPSRQLKSIQRWIVHRVFAPLPVSPAAMAYVKNSSVRKNAEKHRNSRFTTRLDVRNFFPSFTSRGIEMLLVETGDLWNSKGQEDVEFVSRIVTRNGKLTIGAPSSPTITNAMMYDFDCSVLGYCADNRIVYTRYADDMYFSASAPDVLSVLPGLISRKLSAFRYGALALNAEKSSFMSRKGNRSVTGIVLTSSQGLSIGRNRKRYIKSLVHSAITERLNSDQKKHLAGLIGFAQDVEPAFVFRIERKYDSKFGLGTFRQLRKALNSAVPLGENPFEH